MLHRGPHARITRTSSSQWPIGTQVEHRVGGSGVRIDGRPGCALNRVGGRAPLPAWDGLNPLPSGNAPRPWQRAARETPRWALRMQCLWCRDRRTARRHADDDSREPQREADRAVDLGGRQRDPPLHLAQRQGDLRSRGVERPGGRATARRAPTRRTVARPLSIGFVSKECWYALGRRQIRMHALRGDPRCGRAMRCGRAVLSLRAGWGCRR